MFQHQTHQVDESEIENKQTYLSTTKTNSCESASTQLPVKLMLLFIRQRIIHKGEIHKQESLKNS